MYNTNHLSKRENNPNYTPWLVAGGLALAGYGAWYFFFREDEEEKEDGATVGVVPSSAWGSDDTYSVKVEEDYTTFLSTSYPAGNEWSVEADPSAIQINKSERVAGGFQIDFTPLQTGLHSIQVATEPGFANPLLQLNVRSVL